MAKAVEKEDSSGRGNSVCRERAEVSRRIKCSRSRKKTHKTGKVDTVSESVGVWRQLDLILRAKEGSEGFKSGVSLICALWSVDFCRLLIF